MIAAKNLTNLGFPKEKSLISLTLRICNLAIHECENQESILERLKAMRSDPESFLDDPLLGEVARELQSVLSKDVVFIPGKTPAPFSRWGNFDIEEDAILQMEHACELPNAVRGALMPDAHTGYGLPIGGVLAVKDAVIPYAVGVDIACRMRLTVLDFPIDALQNLHDKLIEALETQTRFGVGAAFDKDHLLKHAVMDEDWQLLCKNSSLGISKEKAAMQLGTSGSGNHFVEFGILNLDHDALLGGQEIKTGSYLALLSHSGSRGIGESVAKYYSSLAMQMHRDLPDYLKHLAWLPLQSEAGQEYWYCMQLMGRYAKANHELIHQHILAFLGSEALTSVENHHNFAWIEQHDGMDLVIHRKGATPAAKGIQGIIPGSMGSPGFVVEGLGNEASLTSCSHGAGRCMSRAQAFKTLRLEDMQKHLQDLGKRAVA